MRARGGGGGVQVDPYDERFFRPATQEEVTKLATAPAYVSAGSHEGITFRVDRNTTPMDWRVRQFPEGWEVRSILVSSHTSFVDWAKGYYGYDVVPQDPTTIPAVLRGEGSYPGKYGFILKNGDDAQVFTRTNPNRKWDWYSLGGRWTGFFLLRKSAWGRLGKPGLMTDAAPAGRADMCRIGDVDLDGMRDLRGADAAEEFDAYAPCWAGGPIPSWREVLAHYDGTVGVEPQLPGGVDAAREAYRNNRVVEAITEIDRARRDGLTWGMDDLRQYFHGGDRAAFIEEARARAGVTFAVLKDGVWYEKGKMGWWGCVTGEMEQATWNKQFSDLLNGLDPSTLVSVYDVHI